MIILTFPRQSCHYYLHFGSLNAAQYFISSAAVTVFAISPSGMMREGVGAYSLGFVFCPTIFTRLRANEVFFFVHILVFPVILNKTSS
jgi:hypothetical protein